MSEVFADSPASNAGIEAADVLVPIDGHDVAGPDSKEARQPAMATMKPGTRHDLVMERNGKRRERTLELVSMPDDIVARHVGQHMIEHAEAQVASRWTERSASTREPVAAAASPCSLGADEGEHA